MPDDIAVFVDKQRIQQAFLNLIKNALDSIEAEGAVSIRACKHILQAEIDERCDYARNQGQCTGECPIKTDTIDIEIRDTGMVYRLKSCPIYSTLSLPPRTSEKGWSWALYSPGHYT